MIEFRGEFDYNTVQWWYDTDKGLLLHFFLWIDEPSLPDCDDYDYEVHLDDEGVILHIMKVSK